jgi:integrase
MKFTQKTIPGPELLGDRKEAIIFDDEIPGFGLRLRERGSRTWIFQYALGNKQRRVTFGRYPALSAEDARKQAGQLHAKVKLGSDPATEKVESRARASETFEATVHPFLKRQKRRLKARSYIEAERYLLKHFAPFHGLPIASIGRRTVAARLAQLADENGPVAADRARAWLSAFFAWAMREGLVDGNPVVGTNRPAESKPRERVLKDGELREIWRALGDDQFGDIVRLLILTGQRREEIGGLRWSEVIDPATGKLTCELRLAAERTKNGRLHVVPLSDMAHVVVAAQPRRLNRALVFGEGQGGFGGFGHCKTRLDKRILEGRKAQDGKAKPMAPWRLHDIRRTVATGMANLGVAPHVIEAVLNHVSGTKKGIAGVYNRSSYEREVRAALLLWADQVRSIVEQSERKVVPLRNVSSFPA